MLVGNGNPLTTVLSGSVSMTMILFVSCYLQYTPDSGFPSNEKLLILVTGRHPGMPLVYALIFLVLTCLLSAPVHCCCNNNPPRSTSLSCSILQNQISGYWSMCVPMTSMQSGLHPVVISLINAIYIQQLMEL